MHDKPVIIQSALLQEFPSIIHGISTKLGGCEKPPFYNNLSYFVGDDENIVSSNREKFFSSLNVDTHSLAIPKQVHSANILIIDKPGLYPQTDALITNTKNVYLVVSVADCFPILIYDRSNHVVSAVHSGWRGTQKQILSLTINKMIAEFDSNVNDLHVFIGPGISREHFEVGDEIVNQFDEKYVVQRNGKYFIDLKSNLRDQISSFGIPESNIDIYPLCTFSEEDYLHSYRRDRDKSGRMMAVIGMV